MKPVDDPFSHVNLKLLRTFFLVNRHSSFRLAAEKSFRSPSAISAQIRQLEEQLGVALFHRTTRSVRLTDEGQQLMEFTLRANREIEQGLRKIRESADIRRGRVALSCSPTIAETRLAVVLAAFEKEYPGIEVYVREITSAALFESVRKREVDFGIGPRIDTEEFEFETILEDPLYALVPRKYAVAARETITLAALTKMPLLVLNSATALRSKLEATMQERHLSFTTKYEFTQAQTLISMAEAGLGAAILPRVALPSRMSASVRTLRITHPPMIRQVAVITSRGQHLSPAAARLVDLLRLLISGQRAVTGRVRGAGRR